MPDRYPALIPRQEDWLSVDELHALHFLEGGNPNCIQVVEIHGGPGVGTVREFLGIYDPDRYRIIAFDQRGAGLSHPLE